MHLKWVHSKEYWLDAKKKCANKGGVLFGDLDGTQEQLNFLGQRLGTADVYLGARQTKSGKWVSLKGKALSGKILWNPSDNGRGSKLFTSQAGGSNLRIKSGGGVDNKRKFACDMQ